MPLNIGDYVFHPAYGVGQIIRIEEKHFSTANGACLYYQSAFNTFSSVSVWTPVETCEAIGLRLVTAKPELERYRNVLRSRPEAPVKHRLQRHASLTSRLKQGSFQVMCEVVRDLTISGRQRPLVPNDAVTLKQTRELLLQEWAAASGISIDEATKELRSLLQWDAKQKES